MNKKFRSDEHFEFEERCECGAVLLIKYGYQRGCSSDNDQEEFLCPKCNRFVHEADVNTYDDITFFRQENPEPGREEYLKTRGFL